MSRQFLDLIHRLTTRPDGSARFTRLNIVLVVLLVVVAGVVPAFAATGSDSSETTSTSTTEAAPIVVGSTTTTAKASDTSAATTTTKPSTPSTTKAAPTTTTTAKATAPSAPQEGVVYEEDSTTPISNKTNVIPTPREVTPNPAWPKQCNANIALLMDRSSSIGDPTYGGNYGYTQAVKAASTNFVQALGGKADGPRLYVNAFATNVKPVYQLWGGGFVDLPATRNPYTNGSVGLAVERINATPFASPPAVGYGDYGDAPAPGVGRGRTNWQGAMAAVPAGANLMIIVTDGEPTWWNGANPATNNGATQIDDVLKAISQANGIKAAGTRIVAVHVGQERGSWQTNLAAISGPAANSDYFITDYAGLDSVLQKIASNACPKAAPAIQITKTADKSAAKVGDTVKYSFAVKNAGDVTLAPVTVTDDKLGPIGTIPSLAAGATSTLTKDYVVPATVGATVVNTATATGTDPNGTKVTATDNHTLNIIAIKVEKSANKTSASAGDKVTYSFKVTNTGNVALTNVTVKDNVLGDVGVIPSLAIGANSTLTKDYTVPAGSGSIVNTVTACGDYVTTPANVQVCATDNHTLPRVTIGLTKTASEANPAVGDTVTYTYVVTNTSNVKLTDLTLADDKLGTVKLSVTELAPGASTTATAQYVIKATDANTTIVNVATVTGTAPDGTKVTTTAKAQIQVQAVQPTIVSTTPPVEVKGESLAFTGSSSTTLLTLSLVLMVLGGGFVALARYRRKHPAMEGPQA